MAFNLLHKDNFYNDDWFNVKALEIIANNKEISKLIDDFVGLTFHNIDLTDDDHIGELYFDFGVIKTDADYSSRQF